MDVKQQEAGRFIDALRRKLPGLQLWYLLDGSGSVLESGSTSDHGDAQSESRDHSLPVEYSTLLLIAQRTLQDTGMGELREQILVSSTALIVLHRLPGDRLAILAFPPDEHLGRLRYELKRSLLYSTTPNL